MNDAIRPEDRTMSAEEAGESSEHQVYEVPAILSDDLVLFPGIEVITTVKDGRSLSSVREALRQHKVLACIPSSSRMTTGAIGTLAAVKPSGTVEVGDALNVALKGMWRIRVMKFIHSPGYLKVLFERADESITTSTSEISSLMKKAQNEIDDFVRLVPGIPSEIVNLLKQAETPGVLADMCANSPEFTYDQRVELLRTLDQVERLRKVSNLFEKQLASIRKIVEVEPISRCEKCMELADRAFESNPSKMEEIAVSFLNHVVRQHPDELLALLIEKYGPIFLNKRALR